MRCPQRRLGIGDPKAHDRPLGADRTDRRRMRVREHLVERGEMLEIEEPHRHRPGHRRKDHARPRSPLGGVDGALGRRPVPRLLARRDQVSWPGPDHGVGRRDEVRRHVEGRIRGVRPLDAATDRTQRCLEIDRPRSVPGAGLNDLQSGLRTERGPKRDTARSLADEHPETLSIGARRDAMTAKGGIQECLILGRGHPRGPGDRGHTGVHRS